MTTWFCIVSVVFTAIFWIAWLQTGADERRIAKAEKDEREKDREALGWQIYSEARAEEYFSHQDH